MTTTTNGTHSASDISCDFELSNRETNSVNMLAEGLDECSVGNKGQSIGKPDARKNCDGKLTDRVMDTVDGSRGEKDRNGESDSESDSGSDTDQDSGSNSDSDCDTDSDNGHDSKSDTAGKNDKAIKRVKCRREQFRNKEHWQNKTLNESTDAIPPRESARLTQTKEAESFESGDSYEVNITQRKSSILTSTRDEDGDQIIDPYGKPLNFRSLAAQSSSETCPDAIDADAVSESSLSEDGDALVKSKQYQVKICGNSIFAKVDTRRSKYRGKNTIRHYIVKENRCTDIIGKTGLQPQDELLKVNGKSLKNVRRKNVKRIFRKIRVDEITNEVRINLHIRRWFSDEGPMQEKRWTNVKEIVIELVLVPTTEPNPCKRGDIVPAKHRKSLGEARSFSVSRSNSTTERVDLLNKGCIEVQRLDGAKTCLFKSNTQGLYISTKELEGGCVGLSVITANVRCEFLAEFFSGSDETPKSAFSNEYIFCIRFRVPAENGFHFLSSAISEGSDDLKFVQAADDFQSLRQQRNIDERCFIVRSIADKDLYQSLIFRDRFVAFERNIGQLYLKQIPKSVQEAFVRGEEKKSATGKEYYEAVETFKSCWFKRSEVSSGLHKRLGKLIRSYLCGLNVDRHDS